MANNTKTRRTFIWKMQDKNFVKKWEKFQKLSIIRLKTPGDALKELVAEWVDKQDVRFTPVSEGDLLVELKRRKLSVTRVTLRKWRRLGLLSNGDRSYLFTDGNSVVYDLESMVKFISDRRKSSSK